MAEPDGRKNDLVRTRGDRGGTVKLFLSGRIALDSLSLYTEEIRKRLNDLKPKELIVDLTNIEYLDSSGALLLLELEGRAKSQAIAFSFDNMPDEVRSIMELINRQALAAPPVKTEKKPRYILEEIGEASSVLYKDIIRIQVFIGEILDALFHAIRHPRLVRWDDVFFYVKRAGVDGLPILSLLSLLMGLIIAFMSSLQLKQFGANVYVASLVGIAIIRELGPMMTAIIVAGRSGSAFAAEIGTMRVNEEVDALVTMGFDPTQFLAVPKVLAAMIVVPVLTVYADFFGIIGGLLVGITGLDLTIHTYIQQTVKSVTLFDFVSSLVKSVVFAALISGISCQRGLQVRGGAEAVGTATTSAVVSSIFLIIVADSVFAIIFYYVRW
jgi:phospholipid/cholesterol/gamma-HCH transport system permease protein